MNKCPYCRANPCGCGAEVYYPELFVEPCGINYYGQPIEDWVGDSGSSMSASVYSEYSKERPLRRPTGVVIK